VNIYQLALIFLEQHVHANEIVIDRDMGLPVKAIYSGPDCTNNYREQPAVFFFEDMKSYGV
jgi:hypothetical protein